MGHANPQELFAFRVGLWAIVALVVSACSPATVQVVRSSDFAGEMIAPVAILPFQLVSPKPSARQFPLSNSDVAPSATATVTNLFYTHLGKQSHLSLIPRDRVTTALNDVRLTPLDGDPSYTIARMIGEALQAETVLLGRVSQYRDRVGNAFGIRQPASVGFEARLVRVRDGNTLWVGHFFETQQPMTSDLRGFLQRRRWLTAEELAEDGVKQVLAQEWE